MDNGEFLALKERYLEAKVREHYAREKANQAVWISRDAEIAYSKASEILWKIEKEMEKHESGNKTAR